MNCTIEYKDNAELCAKLTAVLVDFGYVVKRPEKKRVSVGELAAMVGRKPASVCRSLKYPQCPKFDAIRGESGRILTLELNDDLLKFLRT